MVKKGLLFLILLSIWIFLFIIFWVDKKENITNNIDNTNKIIYWDLDTHLWIKIKDILNKDNYDKIWINPESYKTFEDFLLDFKTYSWVTIDPINEKFSIAIKNWTWSTLYVPYNFLKNKETFNNEVNKNLAILDIFSSYKNDLIYWGYNSTWWSRVIYEGDMVHPLTDTLENVFSSKINVFNLILDLKKSEVIWQENKELLTYLYDFTWDYKEAEITREKWCLDFNNCDKKITLEVFWRVIDNDWNPISWATVELLNDTDNKIISKSDWTYKFTFDVFPFTHLRFKTSILGYSDAFSNYSLNDYFFPIDSKKVTIDFVLNKPSQVINVSKESEETFTKGNYFLLENDLSKYFIPKDWLYYENGTKYTKSDFDVYLYHFTKWSNMDNLLENDTFEPVYWYVWNIMKTFGMPYIQIIDRESKKELFTKSSNPIILQNQVYHMKELYDNYDKIYWPINDADMEYLVKYSNESENPYPIDFDFLTWNNFLRWPARWSLDRETWVWSNVWHRVLNVWWLVELPFYHIKDN